MRKLLKLIRKVKGAAF